MEEQICSSIFIPIVINNIQKQIMNKLVIVLISALILTAGKTDPPKDYIILSGTISNPTSEKFELIHKDGKGRYTAKIEEDGSFTIDTITSGTGTYRFAGSGMNRIDIYLTNGGKYNLTFNEKELVNSAVLTGPYLNPSIYLMNKTKIRDSLRGDYRKYIKLGPKEFKAKGSMVKEKLIEYLESFSDMPKDFVDYERQEIINYYLLYLIKYEYLHGQATGTLDSFRVSDDFLKELKGVDFTNEKAYRYRGYYKDLVKEYYKLQALRISEKEDCTYEVAELKSFGSIPNEYIKNHLLNSSARRYLSEIPNIDEYYNTFISLSTSNKEKKAVTKRYNELKKVAKGSPSPTFTNYINHAGGTSSLSDFRGKYVYIDIWATWCGPCLKEVPFLKEIEKKYQDKNIEFISISIDTKKQEDAWRKMVTNKELAGVQLLADDDWNSSIVKGYQIIAIPRFILIDPQGNIVSSQAPRPSSPELITLFNELGI